MPSTITGTLKLPSGDLRVDTTVKFQPLSTPYIVAADPDTIVTSVDISTVTHATLATFSVVLMPGRYRVLVSDTDSFNVLVPTLDGTYTIDEIKESGVTTESFSYAPPAADVGSVHAVIENTRTIEVNRQNDIHHVDKRIAFYGEMYYCDYTTTGNVTLSGLATQANLTAPAAMTAGERVHVKDQTVPAEDGLYTVDAGAWTLVTAKTEAEKVASMIVAENPDAIFALGNNNSLGDSALTADVNFGLFFANYMLPYSGLFQSAAPSENKFWPALGNLDYNNPTFNTTGLSATAYLSYFQLPENPNERYYKKTIGEVEFFVLNSDKNETDGYLFSSTQASWLSTNIASSTARWKIVCFNIAAYVSVDAYSANDWMRDWQFATMGADAVIQAGGRIYERLHVTQSGVTIPYFVVGTGGRTLDTIGTPWNSGGAVSQFRSANYGALVMDASKYSLKFNFVTSSGSVLDTYEKVTKTVNKLFINLKIEKDGGLQVSADGLKLDPYGRMGASIYTFLRRISNEGPVHWSETEPDIIAKPDLRNSIWAKGRNPTEFYCYNPDRDDWDLFRTSSTAGTGSTLSQLALPTISPVHTSDGTPADGFVLSHTDGAATLYYSLDGSDFVAYTAGDVIMFTHDGLKYVRFYARRTGWRPSEIGEAQFVD